MRFSLQQDFPAGLDDLWAAIGRPDYPERKYRALGSTAVRIKRFAVTQDLIEVELERNTTVARADLPAWARPFASGTQKLLHRSRWQRVGPTRIEARLEIAAAGLPVNATAAGTLTETHPGRTRLTLDFDVRCKLPAIGGRIAQLFAREVRQAMEADHAFTLAYLRGRGGRGDS